MERAITIDYYWKCLKFKKGIPAPLVEALEKHAMERITEMMKDDLVQDMIEVLTSFCARLYGRRSAKNKAKKALEAIEHGK